MEDPCRTIFFFAILACLCIANSCGKPAAPYDQDFDILWTRTYGGGSSDLGYFVQQTFDGGYIIAGCTESFGAGSSDAYLVKTDRNGNEVLSKTYGGANHDECHSARETSDGGYIIVGYTESFGAGGSDVYLIKTDMNGDTLWTKTYGGTRSEAGYSVQQTSDGGYIITGYTGSFALGNSDVYVIKTDAHGDTMWTKTYGGSGDDCGYSIQQTSDGGYVIGGSMYSAGGGMWVMFC